MVQNKSLETSKGQKVLKVQNVMEVISTNLEALDIKASKITIF